MMLHLILAVGLCVPAALHLSGCAAKKQQAGPPLAWKIMTAAVAEQLGDPPDLVFPSSGMNDVTNLGGGRYQITSYAEYSNREEAVHRTYFYGVVVFKDNSGTVETIKFSP